MAQVFLSYQKRDADLARRVVAALEREGLSVWWDERLGAREQWDRIIEREIAAADVVLVLWTPNSVESDWVRVEANYAKTCKPSKLVQAKFAACVVPIAFSLVQYADLDWNRPDGGEGWRRLMEWTREALAEPQPSPQPSVARPQPDPPPRRPRVSWKERLPAPVRAWLARPPSFNRRTTYVAMVLGALLFSAVFCYLLRHDDHTDPRIAFIFTPLFSLPLIVILVKHRQIGFWGTLIFFLGFTVAHFVAIFLADGAYPHEFCLFRDQDLRNACYARNTLVARAVAAPTAGTLGGFIGSALSFLMLLLLRHMRSRGRVFLMAGAIVVLTLIGRIGLSVGLPDERDALSFALTLFLPWQLVFGAVIVLLFDDRAIERLPFSRPASPSRAI